MKKPLIIALAALLAAGCAEKKTEGPELLKAENFAKTVDGKQIGLYTMQNANGMVVQLTNYGSRIVAAWVPGADGKFYDVVTGFETIDEYLSTADDNRGPVVGRYGNRIGKGKFTLDSVEYTLPLNDNGNHLHGGPEGFASRIWTPEQSTDAEGNPVTTMSYLSADGEAGYPGNLSISVRYTLTPKNEIRIEYTATTDAPTILNPTSHPYINLHGTTKKSAMSHLMTIYADSYTPIDEGLIPTGEIAPVDSTPLDFRQPTIIGERIDDDFQALKFAGGYDHNFVLNKSQGPGAVELAAEVYEPETGILLKVCTDQPGMQFYSGNFMDGTAGGKRGDTNPLRSAIALETQNFPDAPNHPEFPSAVLRPGETYKQVCIYAFEVK